MSFTFTKRTWYIITEKTTTRWWSIAPFYSSYIYRAARYGVFASEGLIKRCSLTITPIPKNVDYAKPYYATTSWTLFPTNNGLASSTISPLIYFVAQKDSNILTQLKALGYPKNFLQIQETVVLSEVCQKPLYAIDQKRYSRLTIFTNEKIFLNRKDYKLESYSRANISPIDFFNPINTGPFGGSSVPGGGG